MNSLVIYALTKPPVPDKDGLFLHYRILNPYPPAPQIAVWVRSELHPGLGCEEALTKARPRAGEIVLNSIETDQPSTT
jgi:hypothetical protein